MLSEPLLERFWTQNPPKMEPKSSQNRAQNGPEFDVILQRLKIDFEQTLPHFCSFLPFPAHRKSYQNRLRIRIHFANLQETHKNHVFMRFMALLASFLEPNMAPNCDPEPNPKIDMALRLVFSKNLSAGILFEALWDRFVPLFWLDLPPFSHSEGAPARLLTPRVRIWTPP